MKNRFDIVTGASILAQGHLDKKVFDEMVMSTKGAGSYVIITTRDQYMIEYGYQKKVDQLIEEKIWKPAGEIKFYRYDNLGEQEIGRYKKTEILALAYEILWAITLEHKLKFKKYKTWTFTNAPKKHFFIVFLYIFSILYLI